MSNKVYYDDVSCIRAILIICIVMGHSFAIFTGGTAWPLPDGLAQINIYKYINPIFISFHLQVFVFIAGFLFGSQMSRSNPSNWQFVVKKTKRILLPMFVFGVLYLCIFNSNEFSSYRWIKDLCYGPGHLWFLPMLYLCYVITKLLWGKLCKPSFVGFLVLTIVSLSTWLIPSNFNPGDFLFYLVFFVQGAWFFEYRDFIYKKFDKKYTLLFLYMLVLALICIKCGAYYNSFSGKTPFLAIVRYALGVVGALSLMISFHKIEKTGISLSRYRWNGWYGVYIYHQFILMFMYYKLPLITTNSAFLPVLYFVVALVISVLLVNISLKTKIGRYLIG